MIYLIGHKSPDLDAVAATVEYADFLTKIKRYKEDLIPLCAGEPNIETQFVFEKFGIQIPQNISEVSFTNTDQIILVDHNEEAQRVESINNDNVVEIVDHHKININFTKP
ncbi:DHH family phosphoesterase, partial [candidate division WWE3 bacterium]|nr:DHH family phosphoesterase [candidate division WWE3 bacterium]